MVVWEGAFSRLCSLAHALSPDQSLNTYSISTLCVEHSTSILEKPYLILLCTALLYMIEMTIKLLRLWVLTLKEGGCVFDSLVQCFTTDVCGSVWTLWYMSRHHSCSAPVLSLSLLYSKLNKSRTKTPPLFWFLLCCWSWRVLCRPNLLWGRLDCSPCLALYHCPGAPAIWHQQAALQNRVMATVPGSLVKSPCCFS